MSTATVFIETATATSASPPTETPPISPAPTIETNPIIQFDPRDLVNDLAWSPDGTQLAVSAGDKIHLYEADTWAETLIIPTGIWAARIAFHPTLPIIAAAMRDGNVIFWDIHSGNEVCKFTAHAKGAYSLAFRPDGIILGTTGNDIISRLWNISSLKDGECNIRADYQLIANSYNSGDIAFSPDGKSFAVIDVHDIRLRDNATHKLLRLLKTDDVIYDLAFSFDSAYLAAAQPQGVTHIWNMLTTDSEPTVLQDKNHAGFIWRVAFGTINGVIATGDSDGRVALWDFATPRLLTTYEHTKAISALAFSPDGHWLASGGLDAIIPLWRIK